MDSTTEMNQSGKRKEKGTDSKMSHTGEREEEGPVSKTSLSRKLKTKDKSLICQERPASPVPSCESMKSDKSMGEPIKFKGGLNQKETFKTMLSSDLPEGFKSEDEEGVDSEDEKNKNSAKEGVLKITQHEELWNMNEELADTLKENDLAKICQCNLKANLKMKFQSVFEGIATQGNPTLVNKIYTELYITEGGSGGVNNEHEVRQIETTTRKKGRPEKEIKCNNIFKPLPGQDKPIRTVLTKGVAGIGKTVSVQKFILDWVEEKANQDVQFVFSLPFRELNMMKGEELSMIQLINHFSVENEAARISHYRKNKVLFIFDGLDECRLPLDFKNNQSCCDVTESTSVDVLLTNLIMGNLFPSALLWITSRHAAANQIPSEFVDQETEVRGFNDSQKEEYFRNRFSDEVLANRIISHIKTSRSLHIMCHIPVFCWIIATIFRHILTTDDKVELPNTLTDMYSHFLVYQSTHRNVKYDGKRETDSHWHKEIILTLGKLAFQQLQKGNVIFYDEDLKQCGIDINEASVYSGVCTQIFRTEHVCFKKSFCFVHLSIQEFLAALYVFHSFMNNNTNLMDKQQLPDSKVSKQLKDPITFFRNLQVRDMPELHFYKNAVKETLQSKTGHLDLFLRFLLGLSLESNQKHLQGLLTMTRGRSQSPEETVKYIKKKIRKNPSSEKCINLFHCLNELNDHSLVEEIQRYLRSGNLSREELSPAQWSSLVFVLLTSVEEIDVFDLKKYSTSEEGLLGLLPVIKTCRTALLSGCRITKKGCTSLVSALTSNPSHLKELDLSYNQPEESGVMGLSALLKDPQCRLETLRLSGCGITEKGCDSLVSALRSNPSHLKELDLSNNDLKDIGVKKLCALLKDPQCRLETLRLSSCLVTEEGCGTLVSALKSNPSLLKELDLSNNDLMDTGAECLSAMLEDPQCRMESLRLSGCLFTKEGCGVLVLKLNPSHLKELDLSYNHPGDLQVRLLSSGLEDPHWRLQKINMDHGGEWSMKSGLRKYVCDLTLDPNTVNSNLLLSEENSTVTWSREEQPYPDHPERFDHWSQVLCREGLSGRRYWEVERSGRGAWIGVTYKGINRRGRGLDCCLGFNDKSWSLDCFDNSYYACHNNKTTVITITSSGSHRVGVYLDWPAGTLSFYRVSSDTMTHLYTFNTTFTEPLYPGFRVYNDSSLFLCQMVPVSITT